MLNFEEKILWQGWVQKKKSETVFSQYKIMLHLERNNLSGRVKKVKKKISNSE